MLGIQVAIKEMVLAQQPNKEIIVNEILLMKSCQHYAIVNFIESYLCDDALWVRWADLPRPVLCCLSARSCVCLRDGNMWFLQVVMEFIDGCDLTQMIEVCAPFEEEAIATIMRDTLSSLEHLHLQNIIHRYAAWSLMYQGLYSPRSGRAFLHVHATVLIVSTVISRATTSWLPRMDELS